MPIIFFGTLTAHPSPAESLANIIVDNTGSGFFGNMIVEIGGAGGTSGDNIAVDTTYGNGQQRLSFDVPLSVLDGTYDLYIENPDGENAVISNGLIVENILSSSSIHTGCGAIVG